MFQAFKKGSRYKQHHSFVFSADIPRRYVAHCYQQQNIDTCLQQRSCHLLTRGFITYSRGSRRRGGGSEHKRKKERDRTHGHRQQCGDWGKEVGDVKEGIAGINGAEKIK